ncbi:hypothetical protein XELAEV_18024868mg [Xenopus laevis]|uniref:Uncharacterized protein n=1 Tax=Xenopus laevis TaxID=8355 RepID=A0A974CYT7_XENLA|nr:hypothetical protein XELAEV_18024868mg [Xenopus laevis]
MHRIGIYSSRPEAMSHVVQNSNTSQPNNCNNITSWEPEIQLSSSRCATDTTIRGWPQIQPARLPDLFNIPLRGENGRKRKEEATRCIMGYVRFKPTKDEDP